MSLFFSYTKFLKCWPRLLNDSCLRGFSGILQTFMRIFLHFWKIPNFEAFTVTAKVPYIHVYFMSI